MIEEIKQEVKEYGITRLCHFTPSRNLVHIVAGKVGILATKHLESHERSIYNPTDLKRLDRHPDYICCSIEYPNAWYFDIARQKDILFLDWVVLLIRPDYLWAEGTKFCPVNAAADYGKYIAEGTEAFREMYARSPKGSRQSRVSTHLSCSPTDDQAEVLIPDVIHMGDIIAIAVSSRTQAKAEQARFRMLNIDPDSLKLVIAPDLYDKNKLSQMVRRGERPIETLFRRSKDE